MTNELTALAPSTMRSRWLLRFGVDWSIYLVYVLPDGNIITVGAERFHYVEVLLQPNFTGKGASGIHDTSSSSNMKFDIYIRKELYAKVVLSSGTTMFQEIVQRMTNKPTAPFTTKIKVVAPSKSKYPVWIGGSILFANFQQT